MLVRYSVVGIAGSMLGGGNQKLAKLAQVRSITLGRVLRKPFFKLQIIQELLDEYAIFHDLPTYQSNVLALTYYTKKQFFHIHFLQERITLAHFANSHRTVHPDLCCHSAGCWCPVCVKVHLPDLSAIASV